MPRLLDLYCGAGGAAVGYARAGFEVIGVDIKPQLHYPYEFYQDDALAILNHVAEFPEDWELDAIHASPPCQTFTRGQKVAGAGKKPQTPDLIEPTRMGLVLTDLPYIIENVEGAPLIDPLKLCGSSFDLKVRRHRLFESSVYLYGPPCDHKRQGRPVGVYHKMGDQVKGIDHTTGQMVYGGRTAGTLEEGQEAMGIDWMTWPELREAIPPAYTEWIGRQLMAALERAA